MILKNSQADVYVGSGAAVAPEAGVNAREPPPTRATTTPLLRG